LTRLLGRGGTGEVFLAERIDGQIDQRVAIKLIQQSVSRRSFRHGFLQERQIPASLQHPAIARPLDAGETVGGRPYLVLEYIDGAPIDVASQKLDLRGKLRFFLQGCGAVSYAHSKPYYSSFLGRCAGRQCAGVPGVPAHPRTVGECVVSSAQVCAGSFRQLPAEAIQKLVREGKFPAQVALKFLAPVAGQACGIASGWRGSSPSITAIRAKTATCMPRGARFARDAPTHSGCSRPCPKPAFAHKPAPKSRARPTDGPC
jgi:hypothetical protein